MEMHAKPSFQNKWILVSKNKRHVILETDRRRHTCAPIWRYLSALWVSTDMTFSQGSVHLKPLKKTGRVEA